MDNVLTFNRNSKSAALLQDQAKHAEHVRKTMQYSMEKLADGLTTSIGTIRRYTRKANNAMFGFLGSSSSLVLWAMSEASHASAASSELFVNAVKSVASSFATTQATTAATIANGVTLSGSLSERFQLADDPEFVSDAVAQAIETHRDIALRDISLLANEKFIGPLRPETARLVDEFQASGQSHEDYHAFQDAILERRGLALTEGACNSFGVAVCPHQLNTLRNAFGNTGATTHKVWTYTPIQAITTAAALDTKPTLELRPNYA